MKKITTVIVIGLLALASFTLKKTAPVSKIGYASSGYLLSQLPETQSAMAELETLRQQFNTEYNNKVAEYQEKLQEFQKIELELNKIIREEKQNELQRLQDRIGEFQQLSQKAYEEKEAELMNPILGRLKTAIDEVAAELGLTHVFNLDGATSQLILYADTTTKIDAMVLARMQEVQSTHSISEKN